jgi:hypothetical protein
MTTPDDAPAGPSTHSHGPAADPLARALDFAVFAPIGVAALVADVAPDLLKTVVARGRAEVEVRQEQVAQHINHAKGAGQVTMAFGVPMLRRKVEARLASLRPTPQPEREPKPAPAARVTPAPPETAAAPPPPVATTAPASANGNGRGDPDALAIPGYDALSASQVVERLAGLSREELDAVRDYETGHRRRRTILGKIDQLSA